MIVRTNRAEDYCIAVNYFHCAAIIASTAVTSGVVRKHCVFHRQVSTTTHLVKTDYYGLIRISEGANGLDAVQVRSRTPRLRTRSRGSSWTG